MSCCRGVERLAGTAPVCCRRVKRFEVWRQLAPIADARSARRSQRWAPSYALTSRQAVAPGARATRSIGRASGKQAEPRARAV